MPIRGSPNGARHSCPQVVAIIRNAWSRSFGARTKPADELRVERYPGREMCAAAERLSNFQTCRGNNVNG